MPPTTASAAPYPFWQPRFWWAYSRTMRPYLLFLSGAAGLAGVSFAEYPIGWRGLVLTGILFLTYGFGQALTDCFQTDTDALSSPYRPLVQGLVTRRAVAVCSIAFLIACAAVIGLFSLMALALGLAGVAGLASYTWFKRRWWGGPPWNAWIFALLALIARVALDPAAPRAILGDTRFRAALGVLFLSYANFVLVGYLKDLEADRHTGYRTFPVVFGWQANAVLTDAVLLLATISAMIVIGWPPPGALPLIALAIAVAAGVAGQLSAHLQPDPRRAYIPTLFACRAVVLFALTVVVANQERLWPALLVFYALFELALRQRPEPTQV
ncbi:MAG: hypothetical protein AMS25_00135 [Gemmatimonas sp. SM23_52]|nr:MAG: hypothetical protein AMS25_00135 [Gemmatimonas sp. SM23_52]